MSEPSACPKSEQLQQLILGQLPNAASEALEQHLEQCRRCEETIEVLKADDTLVALVRARGVELVQADPPEVSALISKLSQAARPADEPLDLSATNTIIAGSITPANVSATDVRIVRPSGSEVSSTEQPPRALYDFLAPPQTPDELGRLGPYRVLQVLGAGGMGVVFLAEDPQLQRRVALKAMKPSLAVSESARIRFLREARTTAAIEHDHIVTIYQVGDDRGVPFLAMQFLHGESLEDRLRRERSLPLADVLRIGREVASGLAAAHRQGLIHRDIKPANIWLEARNEAHEVRGQGTGARGQEPEVREQGTGVTGPPSLPLALTPDSCPLTPARAKILDFGLARATDDELHLTQTGTVAGTPAYMAPEQAQGEQVDHRADLFSLGAMLYRLCTGELPFKGANPMAILMAIGMQQPKPPRDLNPDLPEAVSDLVLRLLAKQPSERPQSAREVVEAIAIIEHQTTATTAGGWALLPVIPNVTGKSAHPPSPTPSESPATPISPASRVASAPGTSQDATAVRGLTPPGSPTPVERTQTDMPRPSSGTRESSDRSLTTSATDIPHPSESFLTLPSTAVLPIRRRSIPTQRVALALGGVLLMLLAAVVYHILTDQGTLVVTIEDPAVQAILEQDGLVIRDKHSDRTWTITATETKPLPSGKYQVEGKPNLQLLVTDDSGAEVTTDEFTLKRKGEVRVRVTLEHAARVGGKEPATSITTDPDHRAAEYVLSIGGTISIKENGQERPIAAIGDLPRGAFELKAVELSNSPKVSDVGLSYFKDCKNLTGLHLGGTQVSDAGLAHFKDCQNLTSLNLERLVVSDAGLIQFKDCQNLTYLELGGTQVSDAGLAHFKNCKNLNVLYLAATQVSDAGLAHFKDCKNLTHLILNGTQLSDAGLAHFKDCQNLKYFILFNTKVTDAGLTELASCPKLVSVNVQNTKVSEAGVKKLSAALPGCKIEWDGGVIEPRPTDPDRHAAEYVLSIGGNIKIKDNGQERAVTAVAELPREVFELTAVTLNNNRNVSDAGLAHFKDCKNLTELHLYGTPVTDAGLAHFKDCKNVTILDLNVTKVSDAGLAHFQDCENLTELRLDHTDVSDAGLAHFKDCKNLTVLDLTSTVVSDVGMAHFKDCKNLTELYMYGTRVTDAGLAHFKDCKNLTALKLGDTKVSDAGLAHFKDCKHLTYLHLAATKVSDAGLADFRDCKNLTQLALSDTQVSDAGLAHFKDCKNLTALGLAGTQVSDAGLVDLASLRSLTELHLPNTRISHRGYEQLKAALPKCQITWSEPNRSVAESVLALGGTVEIGSLDRPESRPVQVAADLPGDYFQVRRVSLAGVTKPLDPLRPLLALLTFPQFDRLESIDLSGNTGLDYSFLVPIHGLRELTLANAGLNDASPANLPKLTSLQRLVLDGNDIRGTGLTHLSHQPELIDLSLGHPNLTNLSAENLAELKPLKRLSLAGSGLTNAGIKHLANLTNLETLDLRRTKVTATGIDELKKALPKCKIEWDGGVIEPTAK